MVRSSKEKLIINPNEYGLQLYGEEELIGVVAALKSGHLFRYSTYDETPSDRFEKDACKLLNVKHALALNNGTSALKVALKSLGVKSGDRVLVSAYTFVATAASVVQMGAIPVPIDFDFNTGMNLEELEQELKKGGTVVMPVHLQGRAFNIKPIVDLATQYGVYVVEDSAQALGAKYENTYAGCFGNIGIYSFQQNKLLTSGEGGLLVTNNSDLYNKSRIFADHGVVRELMSWDSDDAQIGDNYRMNNIHAVILESQIRKFSILVNMQRENRAYIMKEAGLIDAPYIINSPDESGETGMNILFLLNGAETVKQAKQYALSKKVELRSLWSKPYYLFDVFKRHGLDCQNLGKSSCKNAEEISQRLVSLSVPPILSKVELEAMVEVIRDLQRLQYLK